MEMMIDGPAVPMVGQTGISFSEVTEDLRHEYMHCKTHSRESRVSDLSYAKAKKEAKRVLGDP